VQPRVELLQRGLTIDEKQLFAAITPDLERTNFGFLKGKLVCVDYA